MSAVSALRLSDADERIDRKLQLAEFLPFTDTAEEAETLRKELPA